MITGQDGWKVVASYIDSRLSHMSIVEGHSMYWITVIYYPLKSSYLDRSEPVDGGSAFILLTANSISLVIKEQINFA